MIIVLSYVFRAYRWQALLQPSLKVDVGGLYSPMMVGFMGNFLPARAAEILRPYFLSKKYDITFSAALASVIMERLFDLIMLLLVLIWVFWFDASVFSSDIEFSGFSVQDMAIKFGQICMLATMTFLAFIYLLLNHKLMLMKLVNWFTGFLAKRWAKKIEYLITEGLDMVDYIWREEEINNRNVDTIKEILDKLQFFINAGGYGKNLRIIARKE